ncbi:MAG: signal peptide peptidase SppA [Helicobacteraceae bacterium]|jgi:protease-4|nr:signal peptide peptidase SppA [Helicobacteraceae bacterium]
MAEFFKKLFYLITAPIAFIQNHFKAVLLVLIFALALLFSQSERQPNLYVIELYGEIFDASEFLANVEKAKAEHVKGVLLVVDSPGGAIAPSVEMMMAVRDLSRRKPVVAYASDVMASGSYYASAWANEIVANPGGLIGSIGVVIEGANMSKLLDTIGVKINVVKAGEYKEVGAFYRDPTAAEQAQLESLIEDIYDMFVSDVAQARGLDVAKSSQFANGRVFTPKQALNARLIDHLGGINFAKERLIKLSKVDNPIWNEKSNMEKLLEGVKKEAKLLAADLLTQKIKAKMELNP